MKITITGSLGNISKPLTKRLVQEGDRLTEISSDQERRPEIGALDAKAAIKDYYRNRPTLGNEKLEDFAKEFAQVYG